MGRCLPAETDVRPTRAPSNPRSTVSPSSRRPAAALAALTAVTALTAMTAMGTITALGAAPALAAVPPPTGLAPAGAPAAASGPAALRGAPLVVVPSADRAPYRLGSTPTSTFVPEVDRTAATGGSTAPGRAGVLAPAPLSQWQVRFVTGADQTTGAPTPWPAEAQAAYQRAVDTWSRVVSSPVPVVVDATWIGFSDPRLLGQTGPTAVCFDETVPKAPSYAVALCEAADGTELNPGSADIAADFNSRPGTAWYFGTGQPPSNQIDFTSVALHELGHGLGLLGTMTKEGAIGSYGLNAAGDHPLVFDGLVRTPERRLLDFPNASTALGSALTGGALSWTGPLGTTAAGGNPRMYSPRTWEEGSSFSHLDERTYPPGTPDSLMTPVLQAGEAIRDPGNIALGMLMDMGYPPYQVKKFVDALYRDFLDRGADPGGLAGWTDAIVSGRLSRYQVAFALATSTEYLNTVVTRYYRTILGREPEPGGREHWVRTIQGGTPIATVAAGFYASQENYQKVQNEIPGTGEPDAEWVESLYLALLGRAADPDGRAAWVREARAQGRLAVTVPFYASPETLARRVALLYQSLLGRAPDPSASGWSAVVAREGDLSLAATLATSAEYYDRAQVR